MSALKLSFIIAAIDKATEPVRKVNERIEKMTEPVRRVRASFNSLVRESGLTRIADQAKVVGEKFRGVTSALRGIGAAGLVAAAGVAALWFPMKRVIDDASKIGDTANMLGMSAREFQRISYALTLDGSSAEDAATSLRFLQKNAQDAIRGNKELQKAFERVGMSAQFVTKNLGDPAALLMRLSDGMEKLPTQAARIESGMTLMGNGGAKTIQTLSQGSDVIRRLGDEAEATGTVLSDDMVKRFKDTGDELTKLSAVLTGVARVITAAALPVIDKIAAQIKAWAVANRALIATRVTGFVERLMTNLPRIVDTTLRIVGAVGAAIVVMDRIAQVMGGWDNVITALAGVLALKLVVAIYALGAAIVAMIPTIITFGAILLTTPIGWFLGAVALLAGAAYLVYRNWAPISEFFTNLWDGIVGAATDGIEFIMGKVNAVLAFVQGVILKLDSITPEWVKKWTLPGGMLAAAANAIRPAVAPAVAAANAVAPAVAPIAAANARRPAGAAPSALPGGARAARAEVGGTINIKIDQEGRAKVASMQSDNPGVDFDIHSGMLGVGS
jgi:hypothetical protein